MTKMKKLLKKLEVKLRIALAKSRFSAFIIKNIISLHRALDEGECKTFAMAINTSVLDGKQTFLRLVIQKSIDDWFPPIPAVNGNEEAKHSFSD